MKPILWIMSFNCTFMELKYAEVNSADSENHCFNCTFMELKYESVSDVIDSLEQF